MRIPRSIQRLIEAFERLPGIGPKTAARLTFYLLHVPQEELDNFSQAVGNLKKETITCQTCFNVGEENPCTVCSDSTRDRSIICVVETPLDILALEKTGKYKGLYHVLGGVINPLQNIGPDELYIGQFLTRLTGSGLVKEVILATNPTMEGEATAMYLAKKLKSQNLNLKITRLGQGLPTGGDLEYADELTLTRALEGRREY